jgi:hypothetical protein
VYFKLFWKILVKLFESLFIELFKIMHILIINFSKYHLAIEFLPNFHSYNFSTLILSEYSTLVSYGNFPEVKNELL